MKKILVCDLDGTLVEYPGIRKLPWNLTPLRIIPLRAMCLGMTTWSFSFLQKRLAEPTETYKIIQDLEMNFVVMSARTHFLREPYKTVNELLELENEDERLSKEEIHLRNGSYGFFEQKPNRFKHKKETIEKLQEEYEIIAVVEDEPKTRHFLKKEIQPKVIPPDPKEIEELK